jgi:hypothetical protein
MWREDEIGKAPSGWIAVTLEFEAEIRQAAAIKIDTKRLAAPSWCAAH